MKRTAIFWICCFTCMLIVGCSQNNESNSKASGLILNENVIYPENEPPFIQVKQKDSLEINSTVDDYPSRPEISSDKSKMVYIAPFEFEMAGDVWFYIPSNDAPQKIIIKDAFGTDKSVKKLQWVDNDQLLVLVGNKVGTVASNRELHLYDLSTKNTKPILTVDEKQNIQEITIDTQNLVLNTGTYNEDFTENTTASVSYSIEKLFTSE